MAEPIPERRLNSAIPCPQEALAPRKVLNCDLHTPFSTHNVGIGMGLAMPFSTCRPHRQFQELT